MPVVFKTISIMWFPEVKGKDDCNIPFTSVETVLIIALLSLMSYVPWIRSAANIPIVLLPETL